MATDPEALSQDKLHEAVQALGIDPDGVESVWIGLAAPEERYVRVHRTHEDAMGNRVTVTSEIPVR